MYEQQITERVMSSCRLAARRAAAFADGRINYPQLQ